MARPSLPTLTWTQSSVQNITTATTKEVLDAVVTLLGSSTSWEVVSSNTDTTAVAVAFVEIRAKASTALPNQRIVLACTGTGNLSAGSMALVTEAGTRCAAPIADNLSFNYSPEGGAGGGLTVDSDEPYGNRAIGYIGCCEDIDGVDTFNVWLIESDEVLAIAFENASSTHMFGLAAGPMWIGATTATNDVDTSDRLYGVFGMADGAGWSGYFWNYGNQHAWSNTDNNTAHNLQRAMCFDPAEADGTDAVIQLERIGISGSGSPPNASTMNGLTAASGALVGADVNYFTPSGVGFTMAVWRYVGVLRQMRMIRNQSSRVIISSGGSDVAVVWGGHPVLDEHSIGFTNS